MTNAHAEPKITRTDSEIRAEVARWRGAGEKVALVPTMGALHEGHLSLIDFARTFASRIVVSIFVNPTQFGEGEDFETYPRTWDQDIAMLTERGVLMLSMHQPQRRCTQTVLQQASRLKALPLN